MFTLTASTIISRAAALLNDTDSTRWTTTETLGWLTDGQREIVGFKPSACTKTITHTLVAGARQSLASYSDFNLLLNIKRNLRLDGTTPGPTIRVADAALLDMLDPQWQFDTASETVQHFTYDMATRTVFQVYPPVVAGVKVEVIYSYIPVPFATLSDALSVPDILGTALIDYVCYRALTKDAEYGDISSKAAAHYKLFTDAVAKY
jgi:hypothetical protein